MVANNGTGRVTMLVIHALERFIEMLVIHALERFIERNAYQKLIKVISY